jgi:hypothetical protein
MKIEIKVNGRIVGMVDSLNIVESKNFCGLTRTGVKFDRIKFNREMVSEAFSRGFISANSQQLHLQIS